MPKHLVNKFQLVAGLLFEVLLSHETPQYSYLLLDILLEIEFVLRTELDIAVVVVQSFFRDPYQLCCFLKIYLRVLMCYFSPF